MDGKTRVLINEIISADRICCLVRVKGSTEWEAMEVDTSRFDQEEAMEAYLEAPVVRVMTAQEIPSDLLSRLVDSVSAQDRILSLIEKGREFLYVEDRDGDISYNFPLYLSGELYRYSIQSDDY